MNGSAWRQRVGALATLALVSAAWVLTGPAPQSAAVVGGVPTPVEQVPWQALVIVEPDNRLCGGAIIDPGWLVTAAHCVVGFRGDQIDAHAGITSLSERSPGNQVQIAEVIVHPSWDPANFQNDIALLRLAAPLPVTSRTASISLPAGLDAASWPPAGGPAVISGWGATEFGGSRPINSGEPSCRFSAIPETPCVAVMAATSMSEWRFALVFPVVASIPARATAVARWWSTRWVPRCWRD